ncbi:hypothetical protein K461DRAFT_53277 [Myriangium duriaei CBS 260.36]|uniref:Uncharacterized protein n=1 Tax=Myriangium duriaei CBS 260.36 TaxID=1168546 RepID=A0A9P4IRQ8_9PEZI|nr:hypothetical protein K461DRAFT_53277 [Myriangium duriaei CBS 260.36]
MPPYWEATAYSGKFTVLSTTRVIFVSCFVVVAHPTSTPPSIHFTQHCEILTLQRIDEEIEGSSPSPEDTIIVRACTDMRRTAETPDSTPFIRSTSLAQDQEPQSKTAAPVTITG